MSISIIILYSGFPCVQDAEISMFEPIFEFLPSRSKNWLQQNAGLLYSHLIYAFVFPADFAKRWFGILNGTQVMRPEYALVFLELIGCLLLGPSLGSGLQAWLLIHLASSYFFALCGLNAAHHHPTCFHDGDEARPDPDFG
jgi:hypothetical protein